MRYRDSIRLTALILPMLLIYALPSGTQIAGSKAGELLSGLAVHTVQAMHVRLPSAIPMFIPATDPMLSYPYHSPRFTQLIAESYKDPRAAGPEDFYKWMDRAYTNSGMRIHGKEKLTLGRLLASGRRDLARIADPAEKADAEAAMGALLHRLIKTIIPRFSLDRGFEFYNVVKTGERQCFLQSVLISGMLQDMGIDAGVAMVYRSPRGEESNNGHAVTFIKLSDGRDLIVDASEPEPYAHQQGLFVSDTDYRYVVPTYSPGSFRIASYSVPGTGETIPAKRLRALDYDFVRSQFWYYRGERVPNGLLSSAPTREGIAAAASALETSVKLCPRNPLSTYMLGRAYLKQGMVKEAHDLFARAYKLYYRFGWVPAAPKQYLAMT